MNPVTHCRVYHKNSKSFVYLSQFKFDRPYVIFLHGSHGFTKHNLKYITLLCSLGFSVIAPNHMVYNTCDEYNSTIDTIEGNKSTYKCVINLRLREIEVILDYINDNNITLIGSSEGGVIASICKHPSIVCKIISSYSGEHTYFHDTCLYTRPDMKIINIIGSHDEYFGRFDSIMSKLKSTKPFIGHASYCLSKKNTHYSHVYVLANCHHNFLFECYSTVRKLLLLHLRSQTKLDNSKISNIVLQDQRIIWFQIQLNSVTQISTFGKKIYILERKNS